MQPLADIHVADLNTVRCDCPAGSGLRPVRCLDLVFGGPHPEPFYKQSSHTAWEAGRSGHVLLLPSPRHQRTPCCWRGPARCPAEAVRLSQAWSHASRQLPGSTRVQSNPAWERGLLLHSAAAAAKSLPSCLTLCDPIDGSLRGSSVPGILQARTLEWVAIAFSPPAL